MEVSPREAEREPPIEELVLTGGWYGGLDMEEDVCYT